MSSSNMSRSKGGQKYNIGVSAYNLANSSYNFGISHTICLTRPLSVVEFKCYLIYLSLSSAAPHRASEDCTHKLVYVPAQVFWSSR